jgi:hypothetical protein
MFLVDFTSGGVRISRHIRFIVKKGALLIIHFSVDYKENIYKLKMMFIFDNSLTINTIFFTPWNN